MPSARAARELQRQSLLGGLQSNLYKAEERADVELDGGSSSFLYEVARDVLVRLEKKGNIHEGGNKSSRSHGTEITRAYYLAHTFVEFEVWSKIFAFGRSKEEKLALLSKFLEKVVIPSAVNPFNSDLLRQELNNPQLIFNAERSDADVPFPQEL